MSGSPQKILARDDPADGVVRLTLNRPDKRNAISATLRHELLDSLRDADAETASCVVIIRGAGSDFSAGYDLKAGVTDPELDRNEDGSVDPWAQIATRSWLTIASLGIPVIAQIHGRALAGGVELAAACDLTYVATDARIGHPVAPLFGPPDFNFSPWLVGPRHSMEMMLTGELMTGEEAVRIGFANQAWPAHELDDQVLRRASIIAASPRAISRANKATVRASMNELGVERVVQAMVEHRIAANTLTSGGAAAVLDSVKKRVLDEH